MGYKLDYGFLTRQERHVVDMAAICHSQDRPYIPPGPSDDTLCQVLVKRGWFRRRNGFSGIVYGYRLTEAGIEALRKNGAGGLGDADG